MRKFLLVLLAAGLAIASLVPAAVAAGSDSPDPTIQFVSDAPEGATTAQVPRGYRPLDPTAYARAKAAADARAAAGQVGSSSGLSTYVSSAGPSWAGLYDPTLTPPDTTGTIGPTRYIETINLKYGIYDRFGAPIAQGALGYTSAGTPSLTGLSQGCLSDPQIMWDAESKRFYYLVLDVCNDRFAFGFSKTDSPSAGGSTDWCRYVAFDYGLSLPDYPKLGDTNDFILIGTNVFALGFFYVGSDVDWISKPQPSDVTGTACPDPPTFKLGAFQSLTNADGSQTSTPVPVNQIDGSSTGYVVGTSDVSVTGSADFITLFTVGNDGAGNATLGAPQAITVPSYSVPASARQPKTNRTLDTLDGRFRQAVAAYDPFRGGVAVWTSHAVFGGAGSEERWYEIDPATATLFQSGSVTDASLFVWNGAISPDRAWTGSSGGFGDGMVLGFNTSSQSSFPAIQMVSKVRDGTQSGVVVVRQSTGKNQDFSCTPTCRWGDYSGASPDPGADPAAATGTVWLSNQYNVRSHTNNDVDWRTWNWAATP